MASATYTLELDTRRDGTYGATIDDVSGYLINAYWNEGMMQPYDEMGQPSKMSVTLRNIEGEFTSQSLGANLLANSDFTTWSGNNPSSWTVTGESGTNPEVSQVGANSSHGGSGTGACNIYTTSATVSIDQAICTANLTYRLDVTVSKVTTGAVQFLNGSRMIGYPIHVAGSYTFYFNATSTRVYAQNWYACDVTIDSMTVKQTALYQPLLKIGTLGRLKTTYNGTTRTMFIGRLKSKAATQGMSSVRQIVLQFDDPMTDMLYGDYKPALQTSVTVNTAISPVFDTAKVAFPYSHSYWMLGIAGCSELGANTYVFTPATTSFDTGDTTLDFVGDVADTTGMGINPNMYIQQQLAAEAGGRFFFNPRTGAFTFHKRNRDTVNTTISATLTEDDFEADKSLLSDGTTLENQCTISFQPRKVGTAGTVIWTASNVPITLSPNATYTTTARFQDSTNGNARMGAQAVLPLSPIVDYVVNSDSTGSGSPRYRSVLIGMTHGATTAEIHITNIRSVPVYITALQIRGTPITFYDTKSVNSINGESIRDNVLAQNSLSIPAISDETFAQNYADFRVSKFGTPIPNFERIGFYANNSDSRMTNALSLTIGSRITVTESWSGHDSDYIIVGMNHNMTIGGDNEHATTFIVKPQLRDTFWVLGVANYSELGSTTKIAF